MALTPTAPGAVAPGAVAPGAVAPGAVALQPFVDSAGLGGAALRARALEQGYLFLPRLLPLPAVASLAQLVQDTLEGLGLVRNGHPLVPTPAYDDPKFIKLQQVASPSQQMDALRRDPGLIALMERLLGGEADPCRGDIARLRCTGGHTLPHQDQHYLKSQDFWVAWTPLLPCPVAVGPIAVLPGSHLQGALPHSGEGVGEQGIQPVPTGPWASGDMAPGDVVVFHALTVHRGLPTTRPQTARISADFRYTLANR